MKYSNNSLFYSSLLLFSEKDMEKLSKSAVSIAGIGGVGAIASEMLVRNGIANLKLADPELYEEPNLNRQLFATVETMGINKAISGYERLTKINPDCKVQVFDKGINLSNIKEFCSKTDVLICQTDTESTKIIIHRAAKEQHIPVICGSRGSILGHRWNVMAKTWNYKKYLDLPCYDETNHPEIALIPFEELTEELLNKYDETIKTKKMNIFYEYAKLKPEMFGSISQQDLFERINNSNNYFNRHVCSILANTAGCLAATATIKLILDGPEADLEINLWDNYSEKLILKQDDAFVSSLI
ncbi:MAG: ThiF family adenylyltransferase [bacterium]